MTWSLAFPNLLVGLREGLEAGLVVTILIGGVRKLAPGRSLATVWLGVAAAAVLSLCFGAILTFTSAEMSPRAQEIFGGVASLVSVVLVTSMIFWMRRSARSMSGELRGKVGAALELGGTALAVTAFVAVAREGLEAALFVWTNAQAAGSSTSPLIGALIGLLVSSAACIGLYRKVIRVDLARFFTVTGVALIVIVAGVLAYGLRDLQDAGVVPGIGSLAFDVSAAVPTGSWWTEIVRGVTNLDNRMTWVQVSAYVAYLAIVLTLFLRSARPARASATPADDMPVRKGHSRWAPTRWAVAALVVPIIGATVWIVLDHGRAGTSRATAVTVTATACAPEWTAPAAGAHTYSVTNSASRVVDVEIVRSADQAVLAEIEVLGPGTTRELPATFGTGRFSWKCVFLGAPTRTSSALDVVAGSGDSSTSTPLPRTTAADLAAPLAQYRAYVAARLTELVTQTDSLVRVATDGNRAAARTAWAAAHATYHTIGAAYDAFGADGDAVDGRASGLPLGTADPGFTGFHRIELGLWSSEPMSTIALRCRALARAVAVLRTKLPTFTFDPASVAVRAHEILEDTARFTLTGKDDYGSATSYATARADLAGDRALVAMLAPVLATRAPGLVARVDVLSERLAAVLHHMSGPVARTDPAQRRKVDAAIGGLLEALAPIPDVLEIRK